MATSQPHSEESEEEVFTGFSEEDLPTVASAPIIKVPQLNPEGLRNIWLQGASEENPAKNNVEKASACLKSKLAERDVVIRCLKRQEEFLENYTEKDAKYVQARLQRVKNCWEEFQELSRAIRSIEGSVSESEDLLDETDERCTQLIGEFEEKLNCTSKALRSATAVQVKEERSVRLPRLALPEFSGKFDEWLPFHSLYVSAVHENNALSDAERIMYLKRALKGEALRVIDSFPTCGSAYDAAWKALIKRYANEYLLKKRYINELLSMPRMKVRGTKEIHAVVDSFERNTKLLDQLGENTSGWGMLLTQLLVAKLDDDTQRNWERFLVKDGKCTVKCLFDFLRAEIRVLDAMAADQRGVSNNKKPDRRVSNMAIKEDIKCAHCSNHHQIASCKAFDELAVCDRLKVANEKRLCLNCLAPGHWAAKCFSKSKCAKCQKRHHTLLHKESTEPEKQDTKSEATSMLAAMVSQNSFASGQIMLSTAIVHLKGKSGKWLSVRALLDNGSQINIMTTNLCRRLKLSLIPGKISVTGIGKVGVQNTQLSKALVTSADKSFLEEVDFVVLDHITENQPCSDLALDYSKLPKNVVLADPDFYKKGPIDLLLGAEYFATILQNSCNIIPANKDHPSFIKTVFGWVASGKTCFRNQQQATCHLVTIDQSLEALTECMERFWCTEELQEKQQLSQQEKDCEEHFSQFYHRDNEGRYVVKLPFKIGEEKCFGKSKECASRRYHQLERRFHRDPALGREYAAVIIDYVNKGFLKKVQVSDSDDEPQQSYYLPHHPVIKVSSTTTKIRPVFDGSSKTTSDVSLNDILLKGPVIQDSLLDQLLRFRMRNYALVADIKQMYLQVKVHEDHTRFQRILWRDNSSQPLETYELQRVTFGLTPSSFLATRVLKQLAIDEGDSFPRAKTALQEDFYVDDFLGGANTEEEARRLSEELIELMAKGGFHLQKWNSNSTVVLEKIASEDLASSRVVKLGAEEHVKALGIAWQPDSDKLFIEANIPAEKETWTRRRIYSMVARLFDPLGLLSPIVSWAKIKMQAVWIATDTWDELIPEQMAQLWNEFQNQLPLLKEIKFDRHAVLSDAVHYQFHCFSDASEAAYGACVYLRSTDHSGNVKVEIIAAKSRPAPLKKISLARLELCGAVLATKLRRCVSKALKMEDVATYMWTDSTIVLHWIHSPSYTWTTFVANRVSMIQELSKGCKWLHVKGTENPSDIISRGAFPKELIVSKLWYHGPLWLTFSEDHWNLSTSFEPPVDENLEKKRKAMVIVGTDKPNDWSEKYSHFWKCVKVTAYCLRFIERCKKRNKCESVLLSVEEVAASKTTLVKMLQRDHFAAELGELTKGRAIPPSSKIRKLYGWMRKDYCVLAGVWPS
uniref:Uncharacterized protein n=1 Tax=Anopheles culicifacies TaxID=139723 RepID=A0A182MIR3_9DIPT